MTEIMKEVQVQLSKLDDIRLDAFTSTVSTSTSTDNVRNDLEQRLSLALGERLLTASAKAMMEKRYENAKALIDEIVAELGHGTISVLPGSRQTIYETSMYLFNKYVKKAGTRVDVTKLKMRLVASGVDMEVVDRCVNEATVENTPQTLYEIIPKV